VSTEAGVCPSVPRPPATAGRRVVQAVSPSVSQTFGAYKMLDSRALAASSAAFLPEDVARAFLEQVRWPEGPVCPHCRSVGAYRLHPRGASVSPARGGVLKCKACRRQFTVTVGTAFESSHVGLNKWLLAIAQLCQSRDGVGGAKLHRLLGVSPQTARFVAHRVRQALRASRSRTSLRASSEHRAPRRARLAYAAGVSRPSSTSGASRPSAKTGSKSTERRRPSITENGGVLGHLSFEEALASMVGQTVRRALTDADQRPGGPAGPRGQDGRAPGWRSRHDAEIN
jgi:transposase-like protein